MKMRMFEKSVIGLIVGAIIFSLVISKWMSRKGINTDEYANQVTNLSAVRG